MGLVRWVAIGVALTWGACSVTAAEPIEVHAADGRVLHGVIDARSDDEQLWIRQEAGPVVLTTSLPWDDVAWAAVDGSRVEPAALRDHSAAAATESQQAFTLPAASAAPIQSTAASRVRTRRVRNIDVLDACLVNFDRDVEPDGLAITIAAIGDDGLPVAVRGSLEARLFGERRPNDARVVAFPELDRWTQPVKTDDFVDGAVTFNLPFRRTAPEWQFDLLPDAVVEVRLGVFGDGNFAASAPVVIRQFNPLRDARQQHLKSRFMPRELHGRPPMSAPGSPDGLWLHWTW
jgi:hypothetical protein